MVILGKSAHGRERIQKIKASYEPVSSRNKSVTQPFVYSILEISESLDVITVVIGGISHLTVSSAVLLGQ